MTCDEIRELLLSSEPPLFRGSCALKEPRLASIVQNALLFFEGERYFLSAWCIMPNHAHAIVSPLGNWTLSDVMQSWKGFTSRECNKVIGKKGRFWEVESFHHLIRKPEYWDKFAEYIAENPVEAGLCDKSEDWPFSHCGIGFQVSSHLEFLNPRKTPFVPIRSRGRLPNLQKETGTYFVTFRMADAVL